MSVPSLTLDNGVRMPVLGFGVYRTPPEQTVEAVGTALSTGYRHIDTAAAYGNEREVGTAIRRSGLDRSEVFVETKVWINDYGYDETLLAFDTEHGIVNQAWSPIGGITFYGDGSKGSTLEDPTVQEIARAHGRTPAQVMLRWHLQQDRQVIPKSVTPSRIAENFDVFDFELTDAQLTAIDALDTGVRGGPEPEDVTMQDFGAAIPEA
jgi:diketogulonate reductase-like aldo/keto reductase